MSTPLHMPKRRNDHTVTVNPPTVNPPTVNPPSTNAPSANTLLDNGSDNDLPECMRPGWDPMTPGREAQARFLDACYAEGVDPRDVDPDGYWSG